MLAPHKLRFESKTLLNYVSPEGGQVNAVRGSLIVANHKLLKAAGHYERYLKALPTEHQDIAHTLASSWAPAVHNEIHCQAIDAIGLTDEQLQQMGEMLGAHILDSLFATLLRSARSAGAENGIWLLMKQADRLFARIYQGGGCTVIQSGPKDALFEMHGIPFGRFNVYRALHCAFLRGVVMMVAKASVIKIVRPRDGKPDTVSASLSWV